MSGGIDRREQCLLHSESLKRIDENVQKLTGVQEDFAKEFRSFVSSEGPFVEVRERLSVVEAKQSWLGAKIAGIATAISGIAWLVITKFIGGGSG